MIALRWLHVCLLALGIAMAPIMPLRAQPIQLTACNRTAIYDASTNGSTQLVAVSGNGYGMAICGYVFFAGGTANVKLIYGTGAACATGSTNLTPAFQLTTQTGVVDSSPAFRGMWVPGNNALCINTSAGVAVQAIVYYAQN